jgi:hypothetical protein
LSEAASFAVAHARAYFRWVTLKSVDVATWDEFSGTGIVANADQ